MPTSTLRNTPLSDRSSPYFSVDPLGNFSRDISQTTFMGNRGRLHDGDGNLKRKSQSAAWIACDFANRNLSAEHLRPVGYTRLFFLDEVTALTAGHRPCNSCRGSDLAMFKAALRSTNASVRRIDSALHRHQKPHMSPIGSLPTGAMFVAPDDEKEVLVKIENKTATWTRSGYVFREMLLLDVQVHVITPRLILRAFRNGYKPQFHASATRLRDGRINI